MRRLFAVLAFLWSATLAAQMDIRITPATLTFGGVVESQMAASPARVSTLDGLELKARSKGTVRVIVKLDVPPEAEPGEAIRDRQLSVASALGIPDHRVSRFATIPFVALEVDAAQLAALAARPDVVDVQEDVVVPLALASSNTVIGAGTAWASGFGGAGQTIAILDTGVDAAHPFFSTGANKIVAEACFSSNAGGGTSLCPGGVTTAIGPGSARPCAPELFGCFHGTHVAGIAAGNDGAGPDFGVARDASLIAIQVFSRFEEGCPTPQPCIGSFTSDYIRGLEHVYSLRNDFRIAAANLSLGTPFTLTSVQFCNLINLGTKAVIDNLRSAGIATVAAAGNAGQRTGLAMPACISSAISAGATDDADNIASFSNVASFVSLLAPGVGVTSAMPGGGVARFNGTSMAAPHVAGMWALMRQANPAADVPAILAMLRETGAMVNDQRSGGVVTNMRRINATAASAPLTRTFTIHNDGDLLLYVASINRLTPAPWITWTPAAPFFLPPGASQAITVTIDLALAPVGESTTRLIVDSTDADESPYPDGVYIVVHKAALPAVTIAASDAAASEAGATSGSFTITRSGSTDAPLTVGYFLGGTATAGTDYASLSDTLTIPAGSSSATLVVTPIDDARVELEETIVMGVASSAAYAIGASKTATVTIANDDLFLAAPANVVATATTPISVAVSWTPVPDAIAYRVYRNSGAGFTLAAEVAAPPFGDSNVTANAAYVYKVRAFVFAESADSNADLATTIAFTDPALTAGMFVRAAHFSELAAAINAIGSIAAAAPVAFTPAGVIARQHLADLRDSLAVSRAALGLAPVAWTDAIVTNATFIRAVHLTELREAVR
jgi:subtilisin